MIITTITIIINNINPAVFGVSHGKLVPHWDHGSVPFWMDFFWHVPGFEPAF